MKKIILLCLLSILLVGCEKTDTEEIIIDENDEIIVSNNINSIFTNGETTFITIEKFKDFGELLDEPGYVFIFGKVISVESFSIFADFAELEIYDSTGLINQTINVTMPANSNEFKENEFYVLHLGYVEEFDYYYLTSSYLSKFILSKGKFVPEQDNNYFEDKDLEQERFIDIIFN